MEFLSRRPVLSVGLILLASVAVFIFLVDGPIGIDDALRHFAMARLMAEQGSLDVGGWGNFLYRGFLSEVPGDPWWLFHVLFMPFTQMEPLASIKAFTLFHVAFVMAAFVAAVPRKGISKPVCAILLTVFLLASPGFFFRLLLGRPYVLITGLYLLTMRAVLRREPLLLFCSLALGVLVSQVFVFQCAAAGFGIVWLWLIGERRNAYACFAASVAGLALGFALHPHALSYLQYLVLVFLRIPFIALQYKLGAEMHRAGAGAYDVIMLLGTILGLALVFRKTKRMFPWKEWNSSGVTYLAALSLLFLVCFILWRRSIDLLWPTLMVLFAVQISLHPDLPAKLARAVLPRNIQLDRALFVVLLACGLQAGSVVMPYFLEIYLPMVAFDELKKIKSGAKVLNIDWDIFPPGTLVRPEVKFAFGIDESFTVLDDPRIEELLLSIDERPSNISTILRRVPSDTISFLSFRHPKLQEAFDAMPRFKRLSGSGAVVIVYEVLR